ncbi:hypothetical protein [Virgisporangium aurantiacum]|uniref:Uncharacterized protein n=1 Tax=Virgisporangium aurantiacum TaxID=175570 RepID=A0A8J4E830_9ACTN|nr:hypothetical protein [Virgisporangium aurantiacum]GIJ64929.1 hypothetical protein Vau01_124450 [Virgisporangium aurantiacum]
MSTRVPGPLRQAVRGRRGGWRLRNTPGGAWSPFVLLGWVATLIIAAALEITGFLVLLLPMTLLSFNMLIVAAAMLLAFGLWMAISIGGLKLGWAALRFPFEFTRLDLQLNRRVPTITAAGWVRRRVVRVEDLTAVFVRQSDTDLELALRAGNQTVVVPAAVIGPLRYADPALLAGWLGEVLAAWEVPVRHYRGLIEPEVSRPTWLHVGRVAQLWQVPVDDVCQIADRHDIHMRTERGLPVLDTYAVEAVVDGPRPKHNVTTLR